jgi:hypothetical protein
MIFAGILRMAIASIAHVFYDTTLAYRPSIFAPYIPTAEAGGFTALFDKHPAI